MRFSCPWDQKTWIMTIRVKKYEKIPILSKKNAKIHDGNIPLPLETEQ